MDLVSVIVPIFNVEVYLEQCIKSIVEQTYRNIEVILVDDGSPDRCGDICDRWSKKDERIKVLHKNNGGLSDARNAGMSLAKGNYICFVDSDDIIDSHYIEWMHQAAKQNRVSLVACELSSFFDDDSIERDKCNNAHIKISTSNEAMEDIIYGRGVRAIACNKLYEAQLIKNEKFLVGKYHEDEYFTYRIIDKAGNVAFVSNPLYFYRQRKGSIMDTFSVRHIDVLEAYLERLKLLEDKYPELYSIDKKSFCVSCVAYFRLAIKHKSSDIFIIEQRIKEYRSKVRFTLKELKDYNLHDLIYIIGSRYALNLFCHVLEFNKTLE